MLPPGLPYEGLLRYPLAGAQTIVARAARKSPLPAFAMDLAAMVLRQMQTGLSRRPVAAEQVGGIEGKGHAAAQSGTARAVGAQQRVVHGTAPDRQWMGGKAPG